MAEHQNDESEWPWECPTCGPTTVEPHPREADVVRCVNCKEWLPTGCCSGNGGVGGCPHCGEWHADDWSCRPYRPTSSPAATAGDDRD